MASGEAEVVYDTAGDQRFTVVIPKKIILGSDKTAAYTVTVKGDVAQGSKVKVEPQDDVENVDGINFVMTAEKSDVSKNVDVTQDDVYWSYSEITANDYEGTVKPGDIDGSELTLGVWSGDLTFLINFEDEYGEESDPYEYDLAPVDEYNDWTYELDEENGTIGLMRYNRNSKAKSNVIVYDNYIIDGKTYKTKVLGADVYFNGQYSTASSYYMFTGKTAIKTIIFGDNVDFSELTECQYMFNNCQDLTSIDFGDNFDTSNVTDMEDMFWNCISLTSLDLTSFDTSKVVNMIAMFSNCTALESLDISNFDTSNVKSMRYMFDSCRSLTSLDLTSFDTSKVTDMSNMFGCCYNLKTILADQDIWSTSKAKTNGMFYNCGTDHVTYK